ncbi:MAG: hypothetical protein Tsb0020_37780 [Haliangiales bacterium]
MVVVPDGGPLVALCAGGGVAGGESKMKTTRSYLVRWATLVLMVGIGVAAVMGASGSDERAAAPNDALGEVVATPQLAPQSVAALMESIVDDAHRRDRTDVEQDGFGGEQVRGPDVAWLADVIAEVAQRAERSHRRPCGAGLRI